MKSKHALHCHVTELETSVGSFLAEFSEQGLASLTFPKQGKRSIPQRESTGVLPPPVRRWRKITEAALAALLKGKCPQEMPPFDISSGTEFQQAVWRAMAAIPVGQQRSYGQIAEAIGRPRAVRAVGQACGANPIPVLIPCHRVLAAHGAIGGFSAGLEWKRLLLQREGLILPL